MGKFRISLAGTYFMGVVVVLFFSVIVVAGITRKQIITTGGQVPEAAIGNEGELDIESGKGFFYDCIETPPVGLSGHYIFYSMNSMPYLRDGDMVNHKIIAEDMAGEVTVNSVAKDGNGKMLCIKDDETLGTCSARPIGPEVTCECL